MWPLLRILPTSSQPHSSNIISVICCTPKTQLLLTSFLPPLHNYDAIEEAKRTNKATQYLYLTGDLIHVWCTKNFQKPKATLKNLFQTV